MKKELKKIKGITLIALVVTIVILLILAGVSIGMLTGDNGLLNRAKEAKEENNKQAATEIINLKITNAKMNKYAKEQRLITLKELSEALRDDKEEEIQYVTEKSQKVANAEYDVPSEKPNSIYTKLKKYPYEFEIDKSLQIIAIDGVRYEEKNKDFISISKEEYEKLKNLELENENLKANNATLLNENEKLKNNSDKWLGIFSSWKYSTDANNSGLARDLYFNDNMCTKENGQIVAIKEAGTYMIYMFACNAGTISGKPKYQLYKNDTIIKEYQNSLGNDDSVTTTIKIKLNKGDKLYRKNIWRREKSYLLCYRIL